MSDDQPINIDDLRRVAEIVREQTADNWLADMVEIAADEIERLRAVMGQVHDRVAECDREAELRGMSDTGFPRLWFSALSRVAGLDLHARRRKARHPADGSIPSPVARDTSPAIWEMQHQNDGLRAEIERLREERRWVACSERLPDEGVKVLVSCHDCRCPEIAWREKCPGDGVVRWTLGDELDRGFFPDWITHWMPLQAPPEVK